MSQTQLDPANAQSPDAEVSAKLDEYDQSRAPLLLREAADAAALHDRQAPPDPALGLQLARQRVAGWLAILARLKRDIDPGFDPDHRPTMTVAPPPGASGTQLPPGVNPRDVKDPAARAAYIAEIEKNQERLATYGTTAKLFETRAVILERALPSLEDAHQTLGLPLEEVRAMVAAADITPADRDAVLAALH